jgi:CopG family transcriptional regulator/antitoxin EndoAI
LTYTLPMCMLYYMKQSRTATHHRINITLPEDTLRLLDRVAPKGDRSRVIDAAVRHFVETRGKANLRKQIAEGARQRAERDLLLAEEWFGVDEETWQKQHA